MTVKTRAAIPMIDLVSQHAPLRAELLAAVGRVLDHGQFILGPEVEALEARWAVMCGVRHAVSVSSGTSALTLILRALGIGAGDEVITAPNSFVASASSVILSGATPRFADVGDDFNLDSADVRRRINARTRAIVAVHLTGRPADMDALNELADAHGLIVIEDAAQAAGAKYRRRPVGSLARAACFSLHPLKTAGACGDAGMITTDDDDVAERLRRLRNHGIQHRQEECAVWGWNARMDTIQAAIVLVKLDRLHAWIRRRRANASIYRERLASCVRIPGDRPGDRAVYNAFPVEADDRDELVSYLRANGVGCAVHYAVPLHLVPCAGALGYRRGDLPVAERQARRIVSLPVHQGLDDADIHAVCDVVNDFYG
jgi:dTDP-4-amino-4,6-dideoxygalactose transaminase